MKKLLSGVLAASMLFGSSTVFADDKASDIRKQILELTKELAEVSQTEGDITYNVLESDPSCNIVACEITNNTEYDLHIHPSVTARNDEGELQFAYITDDQIIGAGDTIAVYLKMGNSDYMDIMRESTLEWGVRTEYSDYGTYNDNVEINVDASKKKIVLTPTVIDDVKCRLRATVVFFKDGKVVDVNDDSLLSIDDDSTISLDYSGATAYDDYKVYYTAYNR